MPTVTPAAEPVSPRFSDVPDAKLGPEEPLAHQASGHSASVVATRRTDERGQPLSIFKARRRGWNVENQDTGATPEELEAAVWNWSRARR